MAKTYQQSHATSKPHDGLPVWPSSVVVQESQSPLELHAIPRETLTAVNNDDALSRPSFPSSSDDEYIQSIMAPTITDIESDSHLHDASHNPGMGLLLSLSDRLQPPVDPSVFDSVSPSASTLSASDFVSEGPKSDLLCHAISSPSSMSVPPLSSSDHAIFSSQHSGFDHNAHLDTIASAASAAAATQYEEAAAFQAKYYHEHPTALRSSASASLSSSSTDTYSFAPTDSSSAFLSLMRPASLAVHDLDTSQCNEKKHEDMHALKDAITDARCSPNRATTSRAPSRPASCSITSSGSVSACSTMTVPTTSFGTSFLTHLNADAVLSFDDERDDVASTNTPTNSGSGPVRSVAPQVPVQRQTIPETAQQLHTHEPNVRDTPPSLSVSNSSPTATVSSAILSANVSPLSGQTSTAKRAIPSPCEEAKRPRTDPEKAAEPRTSSESTQKRFQCPKCSRAFARAYNLNTHLSTHDPDPSRAKPFPCPYRSCRAEGGRSFSRKHDLQRHVASVHEWEPEPGIHGDSGDVGEGQETGGLASLGLGAPGKKFRCDECGRAFVRRDALRRHHCEGASAHAMLARKATIFEKPPPAYAMRTFPGDVVQRVALQLMNKTDPKVPYAPEMVKTSAASRSEGEPRSEPSRIQRNPSPSLATTYVT